MLDRCHGCALGDWRGDVHLKFGFDVLHGAAHAARMRPNPFRAAMLIVMASAFIAGATLFAKALGTDALGPPLSPLQVTWGRFAFALLGIGLACAVLRPRLQRPAWGLHVTRTAAGASGATCLFAAAAFIPIADATAITFLNPVFAMILAIPLLGERIGPWRWLAAGIAMLGAVVLLRPGAGALEVGALFALGAAVLFGAELTFIKRLAGREVPLQVLLVNNCIGLSLASLAALFVWQTPTLGQWAALAGVGLCIAAAQAGYVNAMAQAEASFVAPFSYITLVFAALYDRVIFGVVPDAITWLGAAIIIAGALLLGWREAVARRRGTLPSAQASLK